MKKIYAILLGIFLLTSACPAPLYAAETTTASDPENATVESDLTDGEYAIDVTMTGGSGKATIQSPTLLTVTDGVAYASITWSSSNYDYMIVDGQKYLNESEEDVNSHFTIPIADLTQDTPVIADTLAMGTPHEVQYVLTFDSASIASKSTLPQEGAKRVLIMAAVIIIGGGILNHFVNERRKQDYTGKRRSY